MKIFGIKYNMLDISEVEYKNVEASFGRCSVNKDFIQVFYDIFLQSDPSIAPFFKDTDFEEQKKALKFGLSNLVMYAKDPNAAYAKGKLDQLATNHDHKHLNINPRMYKFWIDSLIEAIKKTDAEFNTQLEKDWKKVLNLGIDHMKAAF